MIFYNFLNIGWRFYEWHVFKYIFFSFSQSYFCLLRWDLFWCINIHFSGPPKNLIKQRLLDLPGAPGTPTFPRGSREPDYPSHDPTDPFGAPHEQRGLLGASQPPPQNPPQYCEIYDHRPVAHTNAQYS